MSLRTKDRSDLPNSQSVLRRERSQLFFLLLRILLGTAAAALFLIGIVTFYNGMLCRQTLEYARENYHPISAAVTAVSKVEHTVSWYKAELVFSDEEPAFHEMTAATVNWTLSEGTVLPAYRSAENPEVCVVDFGTDRILISTGTVLLVLSSAYAGFRLTCDAVSLLQKRRRKL